MPYWRIRSTHGDVYALFIEHATLCVSLSFAHGEDVTPTADALDWFSIQDDAGDLWYCIPEIQQGEALFQFQRERPHGHGTPSLWRLPTKDDNEYELIVATDMSFIHLRVIDPIVR